MSNKAEPIQIYHNPKCSKSRATMSIIDEHGVTTEVIEYLVTPPTTGELKRILDLLNLEPRELMRKHEAPYKDNNLGDETLSDEQLIQAMVDNPILIERPIVIKGNRAVIGRPPEKILDLL